MPHDVAPSANASARATYEALATFVAATAVISVLFWVSRGVPFLRDNLHGPIAIVFLYAPSIAAKRSGIPFDYQAAGLGIRPVGKNLATCALALALTWPVFLAGFFVYYGYTCRAQAPAPLAFWAGFFPPPCARWLGFSAPLRLPPHGLTLAASQLLVVALPEELFFRGYLLERLERRWPPTRRFLGAPVGLALVLSAALFAAGHVLVDFDVQRLTVFFPGLVFGWMRARTGSLAAGALFHALCNLLSAVLHETYVL